MSIYSISSLISYLGLMAFFELTLGLKQSIDFSRHRGRAGPSATAHTCYMYYVTYKLIVKNS